MERYNITETFINRFIEICNNTPEEWIGCCVHDAPCVWQDINSSADMLYCIINNIPVYKIISPADIIVSNSGDFSIVAITNKNNKKLIEKWATYLQNKLYERFNEIYNNKGTISLRFKIIAYYNKYQLQDGRYVQVMHININLNPQLIYNIKHNFDIPLDGLSLLDIDADILEYWFNVYLLENNAEK